VTLLAVQELALGQVSLQETLNGHDGYPCIRSNSAQAQTLRPPCQHVIRPRIAKQLGIPPMTGVDAYRQSAPCTETVSAGTPKSNGKRKKKTVAA
jgi:hypothetical protein